MSQLLNCDSRFRSGERRERVERNVHAVRIMRVVKSVKGRRVLRNWRA